LFGDGRFRPVPVIPSASRDDAKPRFYAVYMGSLTGLVEAVRGVIVAEKRTAS